MNLSIVLPLLAIIIASLFTTVFMAKLTGRNVRVWFWIGLVLPVLSWLILLCLPVRTESIEWVKNDDDLFNEVF